MARNTNINEILFPVELKPVMVEGSNNPIRGFKAVVGNFDNQLSLFPKEHVFSIVSDDYVLISNQMALDMAKDIHERLFPGGTSESFEIFNIKTPLTFGSCHIDIIDSNYKLNILKRELYVPFVRIQNSYNKTMPLHFQVGFCRSICTNGVIFEENSITINLRHTKSDFNSFNFDVIDTKRLKKFETDFISRTSKAEKIEIPEKVFVPLAAKVLNLNFNVDDEKSEQFEKNLERLAEFISVMEIYTDKYIRNEQLGETAYAFFNVITDYASNYPHKQARTTHDLQNRCGRWLSEFCRRNSNDEIDWEEELVSYDKLRFFYQ